MSWLKTIKSSLFVNDHSESYRDSADGGEWVNIFSEYSSRDLHQLTKSDYLWFYKGRCFVAVKTIANEIAGLTRQTVGTNGKVVANDETIKLITNELLINIVTYMKLAGSCYIRKNEVAGKVVELVVLRPDCVTVELDASRTKILYYKYTVNGTIKEIDPKKLMVFNNFNPLYPYPNNISWMPDVQAIATAIDADYQASKRQRKFFYNSARVDWVLETDQVVGEPVVNQMQESRDTKYRGTSNSHKVAVLVGWLKYKPLNPSQKEMDFVESRRFNRDEILWFFGVPKAVIWLWEGDAALNVRAFDNIFARRTILPVAKYIMEQLNIQLFTWNTKFEFVNIVPADATEARSDRTNNGITLNEFRALRGMPPIKWGDIFYADMLMGWLWSFVAQETPQEAPKTADSVVEKIVKLHVAKHLDKKSEDYKEKKRKDKIDRTEKKFMELYKNKLLTIFEAQQKEVISWFQKLKKSAQKADFPLLSLTKRKIVYDQILRDTQEELVQQEGDAALVDLWLSEKFEITEEIKKWLKANIYKFAIAIDTETNTKLVGDFSTILEQWLSIDQWVEVLQNRFTELKTVRAERIVRTEVIRASNMWSQLAWKQSGVVAQKERYTALDERVCPYCWPMHGKVIDLDGNYYDKGEVIWWAWGETMRNTYDDVKYAPLHPNCRCTLLPVLE